MRIERLHFQNYRLLRDAILPLEPLTLLVGANGSGKSTVFEALQNVAENRADRFAQARTIGVSWLTRQPVKLEAIGRGKTGEVSCEWAMDSLPMHPTPLGFKERGAHARDGVAALSSTMRSFRAYDLNASRVAMSSTLEPGARLQSDGGNLAAALDQLRDRDPERWRELNDVLPSWIPEFDQILFDTPEQGKRMVVLRTRRGRDRVPAPLLSAGTRLVLALLAITYSEADAAFVGIEEPETGVHPRLLRNVYDALVRMAYPAEREGSAPPRQIILTTHSPYLLDLFRDHPESVVVAERHYGGEPVDDVTFTRLSDHRDIDEIVAAGPLGDAWFTGVLGGVPALPGRGPVTPAGATGA